jgi:hypothetical protein
MGGKSEIRNSTSPAMVGIPNSEFRIQTSPPPCRISRMRHALPGLILLCSAGAAAAEVPPLRAPVGEMVEGITCVRVLLNREGSAMEALKRALDLGLNRPDLLATDPDLDALRDREDFMALLAGQSNSNRK